MDARIDEFIKLVESRVKCYEKELVNALDVKDFLTAFQARAVQRELQSIIDIIHKTSEQDALESSLYIPTREASRLLGVCVTTITRNAISLRGYKTQKGWLFPRDFIESQVKVYKSKPKPGRKPQKP